MHQPHIPYTRGLAWSCAKGRSCCRGRRATKAKTGPRRRASCEVKACALRHTTTISAVQHGPQVQYLIYTTVIQLVISDQSCKHASEIRRRYERGCRQGTKSLSPVHLRTANQNRLSYGVAEQRFFRVLRQQYDCCSAISRSICLPP